MMPLLVDILIGLSGLFIIVAFAELLPLLLLLLCVKVTVGDILPPWWYSIACSCCCWM
jgi:hypothetical protein